MSFFLSAQVAADKKPPYTDEMPMRRLVRLFRLARNLLNDPIV